MGDFRPLTTMFETDLERKLRLPVVAISPDKIAILNKFASYAKTLKKEDVLKLADHFTTKEQSKSQKDNKVLYDSVSPQLRNRRFKGCGLNLKLYFKHLGLTPETVVSAIEQIVSHKTSIRKIQIVITIGPHSFDWDDLLEIIRALRDNVRSQPRPISIFVDGAFSCPKVDQMELLVKYRVLFRYVLGCGLGYSGNLGKKESKDLMFMSDYGLRVPVLFYWAGECLESVIQLLKRALELNRLSGVNILPYFLSPFFDCKIVNGVVDEKNFLELINAVYSDCLLGEFIDEPINDIEERMIDCFQNKYLCGTVANTGEIMPFRAFPFSRGHYLENLRSVDSLKILLSGELPIYKQCKNCAWKHICGGIDKPSIVSIDQYENMSNVWCAFRKITMQRIVTECLRINNNISVSKYA